MDALLWQRLHGGSTHLPLVLLPLSVMFEVVALRLRDDGARRARRATGVALAFTGVLGGCAGVIAGLAMTHGNLLGSGEEKMHHLVGWPAFAHSVVLVGAGLHVRPHGSPVWQRSYLAGVSLPAV